MARTLALRHADEAAAEAALTKSILACTFSQKEAFEEFHRRSQSLQRQYREGTQIGDSIRQIFRQASPHTPLRDRSMAVLLKETLILVGNVLLEHGLSPILAEEAGARNPRVDRNGISAEGHVRGGQRSEHAAGRAKIVQSQRNSEFARSLITPRVMRPRPKQYFKIHSSNGSFHSERRSLIVKFKIPSLQKPRHPRKMTTRKLQAITTASNRVSTMTTTINRHRILRDRNRLESTNQRKARNLSLIVKLKIPSLHMDRESSNTKRKRGFSTISVGDLEESVKPASKIPLVSKIPKLKPGSSTVKTEELEVGNKSVSKIPLVSKHPQNSNNSLVLFFKSSKSSDWIRNRKSRTDSLPYSRSWGRMGLKQPSPAPSSDSDSDGNISLKRRPLSPPPQLPTPPLKRPFAPGVRSFPPFPNFSSPTNLHGFYKGVAIALENIEQERASNRTAPLMELIDQLEANQPVFEGNRNDSRVHILAGGTYVYEAARTFVGEKPGLATSQVVKILGAHCEEEMEIAGNTIPKHEEEDMMDLESMEMA